MATFDHFYLFINKVKFMMKGRKVNWKFEYGFLGKRTIPWVKTTLSKIYIRYNSNHFSELDFQLYVLENLIKDETYIDKIATWNYDEIKKVSKKDIENMIKKDQDFLVEVSKKAKVQNLQIFFDINTNGESLVYKFYLEQKLSLHFLIKYHKYFVKNEIETEKHKNFVKIINIIYEIIKINKYMEKI